VVNALIFLICVAVHIYVRHTGGCPLPSPTHMHAIMPHNAQNSVCVSLQSRVYAHSAGNYEVIQSVSWQIQMI